MSERMTSAECQKVQENVTRELLRGWAELLNLQMAETMAAQMVDLVAAIQDSVGKRISREGK